MSTSGQLRQNHSSVGSPHVYLHSKWSMRPVSAVYQVREGSGGEPNPTLGQKAGPISPATEPQHLQASAQAL